MRCYVTKEPEKTQTVSEYPGSILAALSPDEIMVLPKAIIVELSKPAGEGDRRRQMKPIVIAMTANGFEPERIYELVRSMYEATFTNKEIWSFVEWALKHKNQWTPTAKFVGSGNHTPSRRTLTNDERIANAEKFLAGFRCTPDDLVGKSKVRVAGTPIEVACLYLHHKHQPSHLLNFVLDFRLDKDGKPCPFGPGITRSVYQWRKTIDRDGVPHSDAGCKHRINPVRPANLGEAARKSEGYEGTLTVEIQADIVSKLAWCGSGYDGAYTNGDVEQVIYVMVESDLLSLDIQASVLGKLPLPIRSIVDTGGKSLHGNILLTGGAEQGRAILNELYVLGFDTNPGISSLERLPGDIRILGARDEAGTPQRLLYLNNEPTKEPIFG